MDHKTVCSVPPPVIPLHENDVLCRKPLNMKRFAFPFLLAALFCVSGLSAQTIAIYTEGSKQGKFKAESVKQKLADRSELIGFIQELSSPRDAATGQASGKRIHAPLIVLKPTGGSSPQYFQAAATNEVLKKVIIEYYNTDANGMESMAYSITLENASVSNFKQFIGPLDNEKFNPDDKKMYDEIRFTFQKITVEDKRAMTMSSDDAAGGGATRLLMLNQ